MPELSALIERLEKAEKPSDELDALIMCAVAAPEGSYVERSPFNGAWCIHKPGHKKRLWEKRGCGMKEFCVSALDRGHSTISRWNDMSGVIQIYGDKYGR